MNNRTHFSTDRILTPNSAATRIGYSNRHLRRLEEAGLFPKRFKRNPAADPKHGACGHMESWVVEYQRLVNARATADEIRGWVRSVQPDPQEHEGASAQ